VKPDPIEARLSKIAIPQVTSEAHKRRLKLVLLDARRSAWWGTLLIALPAVFLTTVFLQYGLGVGPFFEPLERFIFAPIRHSGVRWLEPLLLFVLPLIAVVANLLSVTHFSVAPLRDEFVITVAVKRRWWNWVVIGLGAMIVAVIFLYAMKGDR
jgi:lantibiotic transport system permease protein